MVDRRSLEDAAHGFAPEDHARRAGATARSGGRAGGERATPVPSEPGLSLDSVVRPSSRPPPRFREERAASGARHPLRTVERYIGATVDGRYLVERVIGHGGMGTVYQVRRNIINKVFAMKVLNPAVARRQDTTDRLIAEARAASWIGSPHIVEVVDIGTMPDGAAYIVLEYIDGESLKQLIRRGSLGLRRTLAIARQLADGLAAAHAAGIVHRDLKPDNVLVTRLKGADFVKILDFGVAKFEQIEARITAQGSVCGTPHYMSPEQATGDSVDQRSDIYSLGVMLYELVCGELPFSGDTPYRLMEQHVTAIPVAPSQRRRVGESIPPAIDAIVLRCMAKRREQRYASMRSLAEDLATAELGLEPRALVIDPASGPSACAPSQEDVPTLLDAPHPRIRGSVSTRPPRPPGEGTWDESTMRAHVRGARVLPSSSWSATLLGALAGSLVIAGSLTFVALHDRAGEAARAGQAPAASALSSAEAAAAAPEIELLVSPLDARIFAGREYLGRIPLRLQLRPGTRLELEARREGFVSRRIILDGTERRVEVVLSPEREGACAPNP